MITSVNHLNTACKGASPKYPAASISTSCTRAVSSYLIGYALTVGSLLILVLVLYSMLKRRRRVQWGNTMPSIPRQAQHNVGTLTR